MRISYFRPDGDRRNIVWLSLACPPDSQILCYFDRLTVHTSRERLIAIPFRGQTYYKTQESGKTENFGLSSLKNFVIIPLVYLPQIRDFEQIGFVKKINWHYYV